MLTSSQFLIQVYWENAVQVSRTNILQKHIVRVSQIIGPHDAGISKAIQSNLTPQPLVNVHSITDLVVDLTEKLREDYFDCLKELSSTRFVISTERVCFCVKFVVRSLNPYVPVKFVNTSMHGVGEPFSKRAFELFGFAPYVPVKEQQEADPEFPTVKFPNPEEKGEYILC